MIVWNVKVKIYFTASVMGMRWHRIPDIACTQYGQSHDQLAAHDTVLVNILIDRANIGGVCRTQIDREGFFFCKMSIGKISMRGCR